MQHKIKFSVIVPVYNVESYLKECLDSILAYQGDLEVIAVDDGSTDSSGKILDEYRDDRLKVFHKENEGVFKTWKYGVMQSTGNYILFVDSDDYIDNNVFSDMLGILSDRDFDLIQFRWTDVYQNKVVVSKEFEYLKDEILEGEELQKYLDLTLYKPSQLETFFPAVRWGKVFRAELLKELLPELLDDISMYEDDSMTLPFLTTIRSLYMCNKPYYFYRVGRTGSLCNDMSKLERNWHDCQKVVDFLEEFRGGVLIGDWGNFYIKRNYCGLLITVVRAKNYPLAKKILKDERFKRVIDEGNGLKFYLLRHEMLRTYRFFLETKLAFLKIKKH